MQDDKHPLPLNNPVYGLLLLMEKTLQYIYLKRSAVFHSTPDLQSAFTFSP